MTTEALATPDPHMLLARAIELGAGIETVERLVSLARDVRAIRAREAWYGAMAEFQNTCPAIKKTLTASIRTTRAQFQYRYAPLDEVLAVVQPILGPLGLSVSWRSRVESEQCVVSCRIAHALGHVEDSGDVSVPVVMTDPGIGATPPQRVGIALTYARRYSLLCALGIAPEDDDDANSPPMRRPLARPDAPPAPELEADPAPPTEWEIIASDFVARFDEAPTKDEAEGWRVRWLKVRDTIPDDGRAEVEKAILRAKKRLS